MSRSALPWRFREQEGTPVHGAEDRLGDPLIESDPAAH